MITTPDGIDHQPGVAADTLGQATPTTICRGCRAAWPCDVAVDHWLDELVSAYPEFAYRAGINAIRDKRSNRSRRWFDRRTAGPGPIEHTREEQA